MAPERKGGPIDTLTNYQQVFEILFKGDKKHQSYSDYPMYKHLAQFSSKAESTSADNHDGAAGDEE